MVKAYTKDEIDGVLRTRSGGAVLDLRNASFRALDLRGADFSHCNLSGCDFRDCNISGCDFRFSDLTGCRMEGANLYLSRLQESVLTGIRYDSATRYFTMQCPERGSFLGYKLCFNYRLVQLLIPADAKRSSATDNACRCSKAKVLKITSSDGQRNFTFRRRMPLLIRILSIELDRWPILRALMKTFYNRYLFFSITLRSLIPRCFLSRGW